MSPRPRPTLSRFSYKASTRTTHHEDDVANDKTRLMTSRQLGALSSALLAQLILFMAKFYDTHEGKTHAKLAGHTENLARQQ